MRKIFVLSKAPVTKNKFCCLVFFGFVTIAIIGAPSTTDAILITQLSDMGASSETLNFNQFHASDFIAVQPYTLNIGGQAGENITITGGGTATFHEGYWGLSGNGVWGSDGTNGRGTWIGTESAGGGYFIDFVDGQVNAVGAFMNYAVPNNSYISIGIFSVDHVLLESYEIQGNAPISTSSTYNAGAFRGIIRPTNDIHAITFSGKYLYVDDLQFSRVPPVPIPPAVWLFGSGIVGLIGLKRGMRK